MASQKRLSKPIKITLTEDQIASIIERASSTRRGLKVESLEDRIAPSVLPGLGGLGGDVDPSGLPVEDPIEPPSDPSDPIDSPEPSEEPPMEGDGEVTPPMEGDGEVTPPMEGEGEVVPPMEGEGGLLPPPPPSGPLGDAVPPVGDVVPVPPDPFGGGDATGAGGSIDPTFQDRPIDPVGPVGPTDGQPTPEAMEEYRANVLRQLRGE